MSGPVEAKVSAYSTFVAAAEVELTWSVAVIAVGPVSGRLMAWGSELADTLTVLMLAGFFTPLITRKIVLPGLVSNGTATETVLPLTVAAAHPFSGPCAAPGHGVDERVVAAAPGREHGPGRAP